MHGFNHFHYLIFVQCSLLIWFNYTVRICVNSFFIWEGEVGKLPALFVCLWSTMMGKTLNNYVLRKLIFKEIQCTIWKHWFNNQFNNKKRWNLLRPPSVYVHYLQLPLLSPSPPHQRLEGLSVMLSVHPHFISAQ